jgi:hypothetical protein
MNNTRKRAGLAAAVLTAAGLIGACPGTAFADTSSNHVPANSFAFRATVTQHAGWDHQRPDQHTGQGRLILDRGPERHNDRDWGRGDDRHTYQNWDRRYYYRHIDNDRRIPDRHEQVHHFGRPDRPGER